MRALEKRVAAIEADMTSRKWVQHKSTRKIVYDPDEETEAEAYARSYAELPEQPGEFVIIYKLTTPGSIHAKSPTIASERGVPLAGNSPREAADELS